MTLGQSIKSRRIKLALTQAKLAAKLNVSFQTVSKWEKDINEPDVKTLKTMSSIFGCTIDELVSGVDIN